MKTTLQSLLAMGLVCCLLAVSDMQVVNAQGGPYACRECHTAIYTEWWHSTHNKGAFLGADFQRVWERQRQSPDCLVCHTTGYDAETGSSSYTGISCDACHQPVERTSAETDEYREHRQLSIPSGVEMCSTCHSGDHALTFTEWETSAHNGGMEVDCLSCHDAHGGHLIEPDIDTLCGSCHFQPVPEASAHIGIESGCTDCHPTPISVDNVHMHSGSESVADCVECHMVTEDGPYGNYLANAGHTLQVSLTACTNCHGSLHNMQPGEIPTAGQNN